MVWTRLPFPTSSEAGHRHDGLIARRIHRLTVRREDHIDALRAAECTVEAELAGIFRKVFRGTELRRVHKNTHDYRVASQPGGTDQGAMARMQGPHRRNEP